MKVSSSAASSLKGDNAILPLIPVERSDGVPSERLVTRVLLSTPTDADSPKYKTHSRILHGDEDCRTILQWKRQMLAILHGLNVNTHSPAVPIVEALLRGTPLTLFQTGVLSAKQARLRQRLAAAGDANTRNTINQQGVDHAQNLRFDQVTYGLNNVVTGLLPLRVLARVKRYLRRECRKPRDVTVRTYLQRLLRINLEEIPELPPFGQNQQLGDDELKDILLYGTPKSWQKETERQGFDPTVKSAAEIVEFMERLEATDD